MNVRAALILALVLAVLLVAPFAAEAQQAGRVYRVGFLFERAPADYRQEIDKFRKALRDLGYVEGQNLVFDFRYADGQFERLPQLAGDLVYLKADIIATYGTAATVAAKNATATVPIVFGAVGDPVAAGIVRSIARPGGNATGTTTTSTEITGKRLGLLKEVLPRMVRVAILMNPNLAASPSMVEDSQATSKALGLHADVFEARDSGQLDGDE